MIYDDESAHIYSAVGWLISSKFVSWPLVIWSLAIRCDSENPSALANVYLVRRYMCITNSRIACTLCSIFISTGVCLVACVSWSIVGSITSYNYATKQTTVLMLPSETSVVLIRG